MALILKTKRLILRPLLISDQESMVDIIMSDRDVMSWLPESDKASTKRGQREVASEYIKEFTEPWNEYGFGIYAVCVRDVELGPAETFIGYCGFIPEQIEEAGPELAYAVGNPHHAKQLRLFYLYIQRCHLQN